MVDKENLAREACDDGKASMKPRNYVQQVGSRGDGGNRDCVVNLCLFAYFRQPSDILQVTDQVGQTYFERLDFLTNPVPTRKIFLNY